MGYDWIIRVASSNTGEWDEDEFIKEYEKNFGKDNILEFKGHGSAHYDHTPQLEKISNFFSYVIFRFYYYSFDYENLTIYEYRNGEKIKEIEVDTSSINSHLKEFGIKQLIWNPDNFLDGDLAELFQYMELEN